MTAEERRVGSAGGGIHVSRGASRTLTRADLADAVHKKMNFGRAESAKMVEMVLEEIFNSIVNREDVKLSSFGAFQVRAKRERVGRNPKTGQDAKISARLVVTFKPSNILRDRVNNGFDGELRGDGADHRYEDDDEDA